MSRPRDFLITFVIPTVMVGPLASTCLSAFPEQEEEISVVTARVTRAAQIDLLCSSAHLIFETFSFCVIVSSPAFSSHQRQSSKSRTPGGSIAGFKKKALLMEHLRLGF